MQLFMGVRTQAVQRCLQRSVSFIANFGVNRPTSQTAQEDFSMFFQVKRNAWAHLNGIITG